MEHHNSLCSKKNVKFIYFFLEVKGGYLFTVYVQYCFLQICWIKIFLVVGCETNGEYKSVDFHCLNQFFWEKGNKETRKQGNVAAVTHFDRGFFNV